MVPNQTSIVLYSHWNGNPNMKNRVITTSATTYAAIQTNYPTAWCREAETAPGELDICRKGKSG